MWCHVGKEIQKDVSEKPSACILRICPGNGGRKSLWNIDTYLPVYQT